MRLLFAVVFLAGLARGQDAPTEAGWGGDEPGAVVLAAAAVRLSGSVGGVFLLVEAPAAPAAPPAEPELDCEGMAAADVADASAPRRRHVEMQ